MTREEAIKIIDCYDIGFYDLSGEKIPADKLAEAFDMAIEALSAEAEQGWIPLSHDDDDLGTDFPYERDGEWVIVTDGNTISVERIKKDAYDHFSPKGRWFELEGVVAWRPLPTPYKGGDDE